jgi:hypothetical protein
MVRLQLLGTALLRLASLLGLDHTELALLGLEAELHEAVLLLRLGRLGARDDAPPLVVLEVRLGQTTGSVVGSSVHDLSTGSNATSSTCRLFHLCSLKTISLLREEASQLAFSWANVAWEALCIQAIQSARCR